MPSNLGDMFLEPLSELDWAYQLHYYLCLRTYRRRDRFSIRAASDALTQELIEICNRHNYHLLNSRVYSDHLRLSSASVHIKLFQNAFKP